MSKTILVTGANRGLGLEVCKIFYRKNWDVAGTSRSEEGINFLQRGCSGSRGHICDITNPKDIEKLLADVTGDFSKLDVLVNNAAIPGKGEIEKIKEEKVRKVIETNLVGTINMSIQASEIMKRQGFGHIINVASTFGIETSEGFALYCASKHGLVGFTRSLMRELSPGINVSIIYPGGMKTDFHDSPRPDFLDPKEVAKAIYFIATRPYNALVSELTITPKNERKYIR